MWLCSGWSLRNWSRKKIPVSTYIEMRVETDLTPFRVVCMRGNVQTIQVLVDLGADVNARSSLSGQTALWAAAGDGNLPVVDLLLKNNASANKKSCCLDGGTPLQAAAEGGHMDIVNRLLECGASVKCETITFSWSSCVAGGRRRWVLGCCESAC